MKYGPVVAVVILIAEVIALSAVAFASKDIPSGGIMVKASEAYVTAADQSVWNSVTLDQVDIPMDGWVIVRAADGGDGNPAAVIGYSAVSAGTNRNVVVPVDRTDGLPGTVLVSLATDEGTAGTFEFDAGSGGGMMGGAASAFFDKQLIADGNAVQTRVRITPYSVGNLAGQAKLGLASLTPSGDAVVITQVVAPGPSWLAVSLVGISESGAGDVLGTLAIPPGGPFDYTVKLDAPAASRELRVSLHADLGVRGTFEFDPGDVMNSPDQLYFTEASYLAVNVSKP